MKYKIFIKFLKNIKLLGKPTRKDAESIVKQTFARYKDTYKLLEAYDRGDKKAAEIVAGSSILRTNLQ